jgi:hypothetical protein
MRYAPFGPELEGVPNILVDGTGNDATVLALSHWRGAGTPDELKADTSTEIAMNYLRSAERETYRKDAKAVSNNHYDIDGLMGIWAVLHPDDALEQSDLVVAVAECGDFERWSGEEATKITCALNGLESGEDSPVRKGLPHGADYLTQSAHLYRETLLLVKDVLDHIERYETFWRDEMREIEASRELFERGEATVQEVPELDLAIATLPREAHSVAIYERTEFTRVALVIDEHRYQVRYRYESWVDYQSRKPLPRIDLRPFADLLQSFEGNAGQWRAGQIEGLTPQLQFDGPDGPTSSSSITPGLFVRLLQSFLRDNAENEDLLWPRYTAATTGG